MNGGGGEESNLPCSATATRTVLLSLPSPPGGMPLYPIGLSKGVERLYCACTLCLEGMVDIGAGRLGPAVDALALAPQLGPHGVAEQHGHTGQGHAVGWRQRHDRCQA